MVHRPSVELMRGKKILSKQVVLLLISFDGLWWIAGEVGMQNV